MKGFSLAMLATAALTVSGTAFATDYYRPPPKKQCDAYIQVNTQDPYMIHSGQQLWAVFQWGNKGNDVCKNVSIRCGYQKKHLERVAVHTWGGIKHGDVTSDYGKGKWRNFWLGYNYPVDVNPGQNYNHAIVLKAQGKPWDKGQLDCHLHVNGKKAASDWLKVKIIPC